MDDRGKYPGDVKTGHRAKTQTTYGKGVLQLLAIRSMGDSPKRLPHEVSEIDDHRASELGVLTTNDIEWSTKYQNAWEIITLDRPQLKKKANGLSTRASG